MRGKKRGGKGGGKDNERTAGQKEKRKKSLDGFSMQLNPMRVRSSIAGGGGRHVTSGFDGQWGFDGKPPSDLGGFGGGGFRQTEGGGGMQLHEFHDAQPTTADDHTKPAPVTVMAAAPARTSLDDREQQIERLRRVQDGIGAEINSLLTHTCGADVAVSLLTPAGARPLSDEQLRVLGEGIFASQLGRRDLREVPPQPELAAALMAAASELLTSGEATVAINDPGLLARSSSLTSAIFDSWFRLGPRARFDAAELSPQVTMLCPTRCLTHCCPMS